MHTRQEKKFGGISSDDRPPPSSSYSAFSHEANPNRGAYNDGPAGPTHRGGENDMFYLSSENKHKDVAPLSQILAETFVDRKGKKVGGWVLVNCSWHTTCTPLGT